MKISKLMTKNLVTIELDERLEIVKNIFDRTHFHHLLVLDGTRLVGLITDSDLFQHLSPTFGTQKQSHKDISFGNQPAHKIMTRELITISHNQHFYEAVDLFYEKNITCLPVVNDAFEAVGIITWRDIIRLVAKSKRKSSKTKTA